MRGLRMCAPERTLAEHLHAASLALYLDMHNLRTTPHMLTRSLTTQHISYGFCTHTNVVVVVVMTLFAHRRHAGILCL